jgi:hypothetical protein
MKKSKSLTFIFLLGIFIQCLSCTEEKSEETHKTEQEIFQEPTSSQPGKLVTQERACYFDEVDSIRKSLDIELEVAEAREKEIVDEIMRYAELPSNFLLFRGDVSNALAISQQQKRLIVYNKDMFTRIDRQSKVYWSSVFIMAHEIGHHLANNITADYSPIQAELEADAFAAGILYQMGADTAQTLSALQSSFISNAKDTKTHPSKTKRLQNALQSWMKANERHQLNATPPPIDDDVWPEDSPGFGKFELWDPFFYQNMRQDSSNEDLGMTEPIFDGMTETPGFEGIVISAKNLGHQDQYVRFFETIIQLTKVPANKTEVYALNQRVKFKVYFAPTVGGDFDMDSIFDFFKPGRRIVFTIMNFNDMLGECIPHIVEVKEIKSIR